MGNTNKDLIHSASKIPRYPKMQRLIVRETTPPPPIRETNEVVAAYEQVGWTPNHNTKSWYRDIYEFYQNNEY